MLQLSALPPPEVNHVEPKSMRFEMDAIDVLEAPVETIIFPCCGLIPDHDEDIVAFIWSRD